MRRVLGTVLLAGILGLLWSATPAWAAFGFEDPQLCVNGQLLTVVPASPGDVYVSVPVGTSVDFNVANCGGSEQPVPQANVRYYVPDDDSIMKVKVDTDADLAVQFIYNGRVKVRITNDDGLAKVKFSLEP